MDGERVRFVVLAGFLAIVFLLGGGSRDDIQSLAVLRPLAILVGAWALTVVSVGDLERVRGPLMMLGLLAGYLVLQILPLPPAIWHQFGGRALVVENDRLLGLGDIWRPISLSPSKTWNSLVSLSVPAATLLLMAVQRGRRNVEIVLLLLVLAIASALLALLQMSGPSDGPLYFYRITNPGGPVGLFSNRNHHAFFLDAVILLAAWYHAAGRREERGSAVRGLIATVTVVVGGVIALACGTRAGFALLVVALIGGYALLLATRPAVGMHRRRTRSHPLRERMSFYGVPFALVLIGGAGVLFHDRIPALARLATGRTAEDVRFQVLPTMLRIAWDNLPFGSGFGSFEHVFKAYEPDFALAPSYLNQAHNDLLQPLIEGGIPATILLGAVLWAYLRRWPAAFADVRRHDLPPAAWLPAAALGALGVLVAASAGDYPLRVPSLMAFAAVCVGLVCMPSGRAVAGSEPETR